MEVTNEMIEAFGKAWHEADEASPLVKGARRRAGLEAVLKLIDPVPAEVSLIADGRGDAWLRNPDDLMVWMNNGMFLTATAIATEYDGIVWDDRKQGA